MLFENSKWIRADEQCEAPMFRKEFNVSDLKKAEISICGLGFFELYINGRRVSEDLLTPVWSDYEKRVFADMLYPINDTFEYRTYYRVFDITEYLLQGNNTIGVVLGGGWYCQNGRTEEGKLSYGEPKLCYEINIEGACGVCTVVSDENDLWSRSEIIRTNIFYGETQDARLVQNGWSENGFDVSAWKKPGIIDAAKTNLTLQKCPSDRRMNELKPSLIYSDGDRKLYDMGQNTTAWVKIVSDAAAGESILVRYAEEINEDYTLNFDSTGKEKQIQSSTYICSGEPCEFEPRFVLYAFRYFEIIGNAEPEKCTVIYSDMEVMTSFKTNDTLLNWLYDAYIRTQRSNMHYGVPTDCPHRERLGYTGDGQVTCDTVMLILDAENFYEKWILDILDGQDKYSGHVQHTAPFYGGGGGPGGWGGAVVFVPYRHYMHYKNKEVLKKAYPAMKKWTEYLDMHSENNLVVREEEGGWCLREWATPKPVEIPEPFINTYFYVKGLECMSEIAEILGEKDDIEKFGQKTKILKKAIEEAYYNESDGSFCGGVQGSDAFALNIGLGDERTLQNLVEKYTALKGFDTGIFGLDVLTTVLFDKGYGKLAYELITSDTDSSFRYQMNRGATTLWEFWSGLDSHNHPMFGSAVKHFFYSVLGIKQNKGCYAFEQVTITPELTDIIEKAEGSLKTKSGTISVKYENTEEYVNINICIEGKINAVLKVGDKEYMLANGNNEIKHIR
ncbi:MAG: family 78 glycoside hydrolase catalytic domain [Clostridia bacterium]|nr:family 78 glycoside hydrolase catalytic domain [Clostridia bacterium]